MSAAQLSTIETQSIETIFTPKFTMGEGVELRKPPPCISGWGPAQLKTLSAQLSTTEAQLIPDGLASKIAIGGTGVFPAPLSILKWESAQLKIVAAQLNQPDLTLKFRMGGGSGETFPPS